MTKTKSDVYSKINEQSKEFSEINEHIESAVKQRRQPRPEFNDKTLDDAYIQNLRFSHSYNPPKKNKDDIRAVTGIAEKKGDVLYSEMLSSLFGPRIEVLDKFGNKIRHLGNDLTSIVEATNAIEQDESKYKVMYCKELMTQPAVFSKEVDVYEPLNQKSRLKLNLTGGNIVKMNNGVEAVHYCRKEVKSCRNIFLGDMTIPFLLFQEQPYIFEYEIMHYSTFLKYYGEYPNADYVVPGVTGSDLRPNGYKVYEDIENMVEIVIYKNPNDDTKYAVRANGIYLHDEIKPLPYTVLPGRHYDLEMNANKLIGLDFAYGRAPIDSAKQMQALHSHTLRLLFRKFMQQVAPPMLNYSNQIFGADIFNAGNITNVGVDGDIKPLNANVNQGITSGEVQIYNLVDQEVQKYIGAGDIQQGMEGGSDRKTATQVINQQKNFLRNMALSFNAYNRNVIGMTRQRILNLLENHTGPIDKKVVEMNNGSLEIRNIYETFVNDKAQLPDGRKGKMVSTFVDRDLGEDELEAVERKEDEQEDNGELVRNRFVNIKSLFEIMAQFKINSENKPIDSDEMDKVLYGESIAQMKELIELGSKPNVETWEDKYEDVWNIKNAFSKNKEMPSPDEGLPGANQRTQLGDQMMEGVEAGIPNKPSLNKLEDNI